MLAVPARFVVGLRATVSAAPQAVPRAASTPDDVTRFPIAATYRRRSTAKIGPEADDGHAGDRHDSRRAAGLPHCTRHRREPRRPDDHCPSRERRPLRHRRRAPLLARVPVLDRSSTGDGLPGSFDAAHGMKRGGGHAGPERPTPRLHFRAITVTTASPGRTTSSPSKASIMSPSRTRPSTIAGRSSSSSLSDCPTSSSRATVSSNR